MNGLYCWEWTCRTDQITKCFPGDSTVEIMNIKQRKLMKNLNIGDQILVDINKQGQLIYEFVYDFIHVNPNGMYDYLKITVENNYRRLLIISSNHLVFRFNANETDFCWAFKTW